MTTAMCDLFNPTPSAPQAGKSARSRRGKTECRFVIGDFVVPKPEWIGSANNIPSGEVRAIEPFGKDWAIRVGDDKRAFVASVFLLDPSVQ